MQMIMVNLHILQRCKNVYIPVRVLEKTDLIAVR